MYYENEFYLCNMNSAFIDNWDTQMRKGLLPYYVLKLLGERSYYGYEIIQELKIQFELDVTESTVYPLLIRLMKEEMLFHQWVEQPSGIPRKYYFITYTGKKSFKEMNMFMQSITKKI